MESAQDWATSAIQAGGAMKVLSSKIDEIGHFASNVASAMEEQLSAPSLVSNSVLIRPSISRANPVDGSWLERGAMPMSKTASCRNDYSESGFTDKRIHADAIDFWRVAISDAGLPERLLVNADAVRKEKHRRGA
jgi:hypothetical protein